jgi:hypothetical protein
MAFAHDTEVSLQAAVTLVNSGVDPDTLTSLAELDAFYARFDYTGRRDGDEAELDAVRRLRPRLRTLLTAERDDAVAIVNAMLAEAKAVPRLVRHDRFDWHVCAQDDCDGIVLDLSRNRSKIFCDSVCSNRAAVAAYRARRG